MSISITRNFLRAGATALLLTTAATTSMFVTADAAYAERGGNGNGNGNGNSSNRGNSDRGNSGGGNSGGGNSDRADNGNGNSNGNGRGALARELRGLNAAHASQTALENAAPNSMPGKLFAYQQSQQVDPALKEAETAAMDELDRLTTLTEAEIAKEFPNGGYEAAVTAASDEYLDTQDDVIAAEEDASASLADLTGGRELSDAALAELHRLLGIE
jgi:hypothetical protein